MHCLFDLLDRSACAVVHVEVQASGAPHSLPHAAFHLRPTTLPSTLQVCDFNLSRVMEESVVLSSMVASNPRWLAPEILAGLPYTVAADVYSFGVIMWELLTWEVPWHQQNTWQVRPGCCDTCSHAELNDVYLFISTLILLGGSRVKDTLAGQFGAPQVCCDMYLRTMLWTPWRRCTRW
jgi:serine/threonine protein kinase